MPKSPLRALRYVAVPLVVAAASLSLLSTPAHADPAPPSLVALGGIAYGTYATLTPTVVDSGKTAYLSNCGGSTSYSADNDTASVNLGAVGTTGVTTTHLETSVDGSAKTSKSVTDTSNVRLINDGLNGRLVTADAVHTVATTTRDGDQVTHAGSTTFTNLRVLGLPVTLSGHGQVINIPQIGSVTLDTQTQYTTGTRAAITVTGLKISLLSGNRLGLPRGTIIIGNSYTSAHSITAALPFGSVWGTSVNVANLVGSGKTAYVSLPCGGSSTRTNNVAGVTIPNVLNTGTVTSRIRSFESVDNGVTSTNVAAKSDTVGVNLLGGTVTADAVYVRANSKRAVGAGHASSNSTGTQVVNLRILGQPATIGTGENSTLDIDGVGTLSFRKVQHTGSYIVAYGLVLTLDTQNAGLPAGTEIVVGRAGAGVRAS